MGAVVPSLILQPCSNRASQSPTSGPRGAWPHPATTRGKGKSRVMAALSILPLMPLVALVEIDFEHGTQCENGRVSLD